eukprot:TRINITY_DN2669_c0_g1_i1.p1 TRINITY_DN2669_c0_g1~~TRINITY_DN2669_c0_g1_i1.p1  ORF type:complete len:209 (+),score=30.93 TRINITY_DN2669_c0_g1_i1:40-666(+)
MISHPTSSRYHHTAHTEDIYVNHETIDRSSHPHPPLSTTSTLLGPVSAARPLDDAQKSYQLADLYEEIARYKKENSLLRENLDFTNKKYEQIVRELQTRIFELENEAASPPSLRPLTRSESVSYSSTPKPYPALATELAVCKEEVMNLKVVADSYAEDVKNINQQLTESQRAKNILSRELQDKSDVIQGLENEVATLTFLLNETHSKL